MKCHTTLRGAHPTKFLRNFAWITPAQSLCHMTNKFLVFKEVEAILNKLGGAREASNSTNNSENPINDR